MSADKYSYTWINEKGDYVLVESEFGYSIINKRDQSMLCVSDDDLEEEIIRRMLEAGCKVYKNVLDAYADV